MEEEMRGKREQERREEAEREKVGKFLNNHPCHFTNPGETGQTRRQGEAEGGGPHERGEHQHLTFCCKAPMLLEVDDNKIKPR